MDISIIIVNWNVRNLLYKCIQSIFLFCKDVNFKIIIVDNNSSDGSHEMLRMIDFKNENVHVIFNEKNVGFAKANNQGLACAKGRYILFMNPDMELIENTPKILFDYLENNKDTSICTCQLQYSNGNRQPNIKRDPNFWSQVWISYKLHHIFKPKFLTKYLAKDFDYSREQEVEQVMGALVFVKSDIVRRIGGWSEDYFLWWEDLDLCTRLRKIGEKIMYTPVSRVIHYESKSFAQHLSFSKQKMFNKSMLIYFKKYHNKFAWIMLKLVSLDSLVLAFIAQIFRIKPKTQSKL